MPPFAQADGPTGPHRGWAVTAASGSAQELHDRPPDPTLGHEIRLNRVTRSALVLGSSQSADLVDPARAASLGFEVCRRRSGGGLVVVRPELDTWIDAIVPPWSPLWDPDVGRAFHWLGAVWAQALEALTDPGAGVTVHRDRLQGARGGRLACFASLGPGEVSVDGAKVVGISQRRTADAARFQCVATWSWDAAILARCVSAEHWDRAGITPDQIAAGVEGITAPTVEAVTRAFLDALPSIS
jgi:lipoate-protein ligase A